MKYRKVLSQTVFVLLALSFILLGSFSLKQEKALKSSKETAKVLRVADGDTMKVLLNNKEDTIRLIGVDAPETVDPRKTVECFGKQASEKARELLTGKTVILEQDSTQGEKDKYERLLRYVFLSDGTNFNKLMISSGYAYEYTYQNKPYKYMEDFKNAQKKAREEKKGFWADGACN